MVKPPPWADLPQELLNLISQFLHSNPLHLLCFRSVCKSWYFSLSSIPPLRFPPLPLTTPTPSSPLQSSTFFPLFYSPHSTLSVTLVYAIFPPISYDYCPSSTNFKGFILFVDQINPNKVSIRKPFSQLSYKLPINFPRKLNLLGFRAIELGRFYNLSTLSNFDDKPRRLTAFSGSLRKVVFFSNGGNGLFVFGLSDDGKLGLLRLGSEEILAVSNQWEIVHEGKGFRFDDIVEFKGRVLGISRRGRVYNIEIGCSSDVTMSVVFPPIAGGGGRRKRLVESLGRLYLVVRNKEGSDALFKVYELNESVKKWVEVKSLGDRTFFFGVEFSFSASADELHGSCGKNWVLFKEGSFLSYNGYDDEEAKLFPDTKSKDLRAGVWSFDDAARLGVIGSYPEYYKVLWPPPPWIWQNEQSERVGTILSSLDRLQLKIPDYKKLEAKLDGLSVWKKNLALLIIKSGTKMVDTLEQAREMDERLKQIEMVALSWLEHCKSNLHNQGRTPTLGNEENRVPVASFKIIRSAFKQRNSNFDLISMEMLLHSVILRLEEHTSELEDDVNSSKFSASIDELMPLTGLWNST